MYDSTTQVNLQEHCPVLSEDNALLFCSLNLLHYLNGKGIPVMTCPQGKQP